MATITPKIVERLRNLNLQSYRLDKQRIKADYSNEREFTTDYNGRQLLELLQNADDAQTGAVHIELDEAKKTLRIANNGDAFSDKGLDSLRLAGNSSKNKREFIGNKGLGFRSILSWVDRIRIFTREVVLEFSPAIATKQFELLIVDKDERLAMIKEQQDLLPNTSPFAVLAYPEYFKNTEAQDWETIIELQYNDEALDDIISQLDAITAEVLLFLKHTQRIDVVRNGVNIKSLKRSVVWASGTDSRVLVNNIEWNVRDSGERKFPNSDGKYYSFKIAWRDDLETETENAVFYSFFPTLVESHLPYLIHGTFELTLDRNHLKDHKHNTYLLNEIAVALGQLAESRLMQRPKPDWRAFGFLYATSTKTDARLTSFYEQLSILRKSLAIYPSVDGKYYKIGEVVFYGNEFSEWVIRRRLAGHFTLLLRPLLENSRELELYKWKIYEKSYFIKLIGKLSPELRVLKARCELIKFLSAGRFAEHHKNRYPLTLSSDNLQPEPSDVEVFLTKEGSVEKFGIPPYVKLKFIAQDFARALEKEFEKEIRDRRVPGEDKSRTLKRVANSVLNLGSNDITDVVVAVTRAFNKRQEAKLKPSTVQHRFKEYVRCLFRIFSLNPDRKGSLNESIFLLNRAGEAVRSTDLFFGHGFQSGALTEDLFEGVYTNADFLPGNTFWELGDVNTQASTLEEFFVWLGVNRLSKIKFEPMVRRERYFAQGYPEYVFTKTHRPANFTMVEYQIKTLPGLDKILAAPKFSLERLVAWLIKDTRLRRLLQDDANGETFKYCYVTWNAVSIKPSNLKYELQKREVFKNVFADPTFAELLGLRSINPRDQLFRKWDISELQVLETLRQVGAMVSFADLTPERIFKLLNDAEEQKQSPARLYETALIYFKQNEHKDFSAHVRNLKVWAAKGDDRRFMPASEVHYTDNATLPEKISSDFWMFEFPKKRGEQQIAKFLGVKTFRDLEIVLNGAPIQHAASNAFDSWIETIKPYVLTYRLQNLRDDAASRRELPSFYGETIEGNESANALKKLNVSLVASATYSVNGGVQKMLAPAEFIPVGRRSYYLCYRDNATLTEIKNSPECCEAIAEILCMLFKAQKNKDDFRAIFKDTNELRGTKYLIQSSSLSKVFDDAQKLLGVSGAEKEFWRSVLAIRNISLPDSIITREALERTLQAQLRWNSSTTDIADFENWNTQSSYDLLNKLQADLGISLSDIKAHYTDFAGLERWHYDRYISNMHDFQKPWTHALWKYLSNKPADQKGFHEKRNSYNAIANTVTEALAKKYAFDLNVDYKQTLRIGLNAQSSFQISNDDVAEIRTVNRYRELLNEAGVVKEELPEDWKSLIYFNGHLDLLKTDIASLRKPNPSTAGVPENDNSVAPINKTSFGSGKVNPHKGNGNTPGRKSGVYNGKAESKNNQLGAQAEKLVRNSLLKSYPDGVVHWLSGYSDDETINKDDGAGYDIRYKCHRDDEEWNLVEVKSVGRDSFIISLNEVQVGLEKKQFYQLAVVHGGEIYLDTAYFLNGEMAMAFDGMLSNSNIQPLSFEVGWTVPQ